jgi:copper(I)-binding protein
MKRLVLLCIIVAVSASGWLAITERSFGQPSPVIETSDFWTAPASPPNTVALVFGVLRNASDQDDALVAASTPIAKNTEFKFHAKTGGDRIVASIGVLPPHKYLKLRSSEFYIVLNGLTEELRLGQTVPIILQFQKSGQVSATVHVSDHPPPPPPFTYAGGNGSSGDAYIVIRGARDPEEFYAAILAWLAKNDPDFKVGGTEFTFSGDPPGDRKLLLVIDLCRGPCQRGAFGMILGDKQVYFDLRDVDFAFIDPKDVH